MVRDVNGINNPPSPASSSSKQSNGLENLEKPTERKITSTAATEDGQRDVVEISSEARILKELGSRLDTSPEVDLKRVEAIRAAIDAGEFKVDSGSIADKILASDGDFN